MQIDYDDLPRLAKKYKYEYQIRKLYGSMVAYDISDELGISLHFDDNRDKFYISGLESQEFGIESVRDYNDLLTKIESILVGKGGKETANLITKWTPYLQDFGIDEKVGILHDYSRFGLSLADFFELLYYALTGEYEKDRHLGLEFEKIAREYWDNEDYYERKGTLINYISYGEWLDFGKMVDPVFSGTLVKFFQNGKIQIKGLTNTEWDRLLYIDELYHNR